MRFEKISMIIRCMLVVLLFLNANVGRRNSVLVTDALTCSPSSTRTYRLPSTSNAVQQQTLNNSKTRLSTVQQLFRPSRRRHHFSSSTTLQLSSSSNTNDPNNNNHDPIQPQPNKDNDMANLPGPQDTNEENIRSLFVLFNNALATCVPKIVTRRYAKDAVLLPSTSDEPRMSLEDIEDFYTDYLKEKPQKKILEGRIRIGHGWAEDAGICEISLLHPSSGIIRQIKARYSFVYVWENYQWKILHHHSSILGAVEASSQTIPSLSCGPMTTQRVQNLFQLLQDALEIQDADAVAKRFTYNNGLLLPLNMYDSPKQGYEQIKDYFEEFLLERPIISNIERIQISIDPSCPGQQTWAKDVGTFQITFKKDQSTLNARYSIDHILDDDGIWKILQFQISPLPREWTQLKVPTSRKKAMEEELWSLSSPLSVSDDDTECPVDEEVAAGPNTSSWWLSQPPSNVSPSCSSSISSLYSTGPPRNRDTSLPIKRQQGEEEEELQKQQQQQQPQEQRRLQPHIPIVTEEQVRGWFNEWNNAMATGDAKVVTNRYSENAVMVTTMSDTPRTTIQEIYDYYQMFLWNYPQAKVIQSYITISSHWCKDVGILEYTLKNHNVQQQRIRERYSFLYIYDETSGWKIAHHHSSVMPQGLQENSIQIGNDTDNRYFQ